MMAGEDENAVEPGQGQPAQAPATERHRDYDFTKLKVNLEIFNGTQSPGPSEGLRNFAITLTCTSGNGLRNQILRAQERGRR